MGLCTVGLALYVGQSSPGSWEGWCAGAVRCGIKLSAAKGCAQTVPNSSPMQPQQDSCARLQGCSQIVPDGSREPSKTAAPATAEQQSQTAGLQQFCRGLL